MRDRGIKGRKKTALICAAVMALVLAALAGCTSKVAEYGKGTSDDWFSRKETQPPVTQQDDQNQGGQAPQSGQDSQGGQVPQGVDEDAQQALLDYINIDMVELAEIEDRMIASYGSVSGENYVDDDTMYNEICDNTIPLCQKLNNAAMNISPTDREISDVHKIYRRYVTKYLNAFAMITSAIESQDASQVVEANDLLTEASELATEFQQELYALADERDVVFN